MIQILCRLLLSGAFLFSSLTCGGADSPISVTVDIDAGATGKPLNPFWRFFGADEPNYAYLPHGRKLLGELGELRPKQVYFRAHNLLTSGDGTPALKWGSTGVYREDASGQPIYDWKILDQIFDTYLAQKVRPYAQIGFMPRDLSIHPEPYQHHWNPQLGYNEIFTGWAYPPKDYHRWRELVFQWVKHCVNRYGRKEVLTWYWEVWNEANIGYWKGTREEFFKLHDFAIDGVKQALPGARVGGADSAGSGGAFTRQFLDHCLHGTNAATGKPGTPLDFVSFHAKGAPSYTNDHVRMGIAQHLRTIEDGFRLISSFPELRSVPIVIGESDPEGCAACQGPSLEYRNGTLYSSYTAASFARKEELAERYGVTLEGALTWAFEFEDQPFFAGFRSLASRGIDKPVLNVFRMFARMQGQQIPVRSSGAASLDSMLQSGVRQTPDVGGISSRKGNKLWVLLWHYHDDNVPGPDATLSIRIHGMRLRKSPSLKEFRIDETHSNGFAEWKRMGSPQNPTASQYLSLEKAAQLTLREHSPTPQMEGEDCTITLSLPRQAVSLIEVSP